MTTQLLWVVLRAVGAAVGVSLISLPLVRAVHERFGLGEPPSSGALVLTLAVVVACLGAGLCGAVLGVAAGRRRGPWRGGAAILGLIWGVSVALWTVPTYGTMVVEAVSRDAAQTAWQEREALVPRAGGAIEAFREGRSAEVQDEAVETAQRFATVGSRGVARLPALLILGWAIVLAPLFGLLECHLARKWAHF